MSLKMLRNFNVDNRVALITGGAGLLGREHAIALLEIGAKVYLGDVDTIGLSKVVSDLNLLYPDMVFTVPLMLPTSFCEGCS